MTDKTVRETSFIDELNMAIRDNPVAAGLIGAGALWMFFGGAKIPALATKVGSVGASAGSAASAIAGRAANSASDMGHQTAAALKRVGDGVASAGATARDKVAEGYEATSNAVTGSLSTAAETVTRFAETSGQNSGALCAQTSAIRWRASLSCWAQSGWQSVPASPQRFQPQILKKT